MGRETGSRGFFHGFSHSVALLFRFGDDFVESEVVGEYELVVDLGFGEQKVPFVTLLLAFFGGFAAGFLSLLLLLRFEANFLFTLFGFEL